MTDYAENGFSAAVKLVAGKWKIDIMCELVAAPRRFGRPRQALPAISEKMLTQRLRRTEADGLVHRKVLRRDAGQGGLLADRKRHGLHVGAEGLCQWSEASGR